MKYPARHPITAKDRIKKPSFFERRLLKYILPLAIFCWPVLYLFTYIFPIKGRYTAIGNDFIALYFKHKLYLLASLAEFHFPLWSPSEAAGFPFYINPFAQAFYPFNLLLAVWYKISGGYNTLDHQVFTILGVSIFALGLFMWLRLVNTNLRAVVFSVLVMSVSFKMTEILRFPNAVHSAAWYPWILYALTKIMLSRSLRKAVLYGILLTLFLICLCTAGYPYYVYYSLFLFVPYLLAFLIKPLRLRLLGDRMVNWKRALVTLAVTGAVSFLICGPYLLGIKHLMSETTDRTGKDFTFSTAHIYTFKNTLGSLLYPPAAMPDGWNFFSITAVLMVSLYILSGETSTQSRLKLSDNEKKTKLHSFFHNRWHKLFFIVWISFIIYITYGRHSYLFILLWKIMPGFSSLRVWPRLNIILVPIFAWLLSLAYASFESTISGKNVAAFETRFRFFSPIVAVITTYAVVLGIQLYLHLNKIYDNYWFRYFTHLSPQCIKFIVYGSAGFIIILLFLILGKRFGFKSDRSLTAILAVFLFLAVLEMRPVGIHIWTSQTSVQKNRQNLDVAKLNEISFQFPRSAFYNSISLLPNFSVGILENWYFNRYVRFLEKTKNEIKAQRVFLGVQDGTKIFYSESIEHATIQSFLRDAVRYRPPGQLLSYTGDELNWEIEAPVAGYLSFIDNWDRYWRVCVDDKPADIELLFGTFKSVRLSEGRHQVRFYYQPKFFPKTRKAEL